MFRPLALSITLTVAVASSGGVARGQEPSADYRESPPAGSRLDKFGRNLFGGLFSNKQKRESDRSDLPVAEEYDGSAQAEVDPRQATPVVPGAPHAVGGSPSDPRAMRITRPTDPGGQTWSNQPRPERVLTNVPEQTAGGRTSPYTSPYTLSNPTISRSSTSPAVSSGSTSLRQPAGSSGASQPLHERLTGVRQPTFDRQPPAAPPTAGEATLSSSNLDPPQESILEPRQAEPPEAGATLGPADPPLPGGTPTLAPRRAEMASRPTPGRTFSNVPSTEPPRTGPPEAAGATPDRPPLPETARAGSSLAGTGRATTGPSAEPASPADQGDGPVLFTRQSPIINVRTVGPRRISVGKESAYEVHVENLGQVAADNVAVTIDLPDWADVLGAEASTGATLSDRSPTGAKQFQWKVGPLAVRGSEKIVLRIVPRQSRPIDLAVRWDFTPVASQTVIEVQEPKLAMQLDGPREVFFAKKESFKLVISNSGNGPAENVVLMLQPLVPGEGSPTNHPLGSLPAGQKRVIEMELTARQTGHLAVRVDLRCDGEVHARLDEKILVRRADLQVAAEGPQMQYMGTVATYQLRVRNVGNAPAQSVLLSAKLPVEAKFLAASHGGQLAGDRATAVWQIQRLEAGAEQLVQMNCQLVREGTSRVEIEAAGEGDLLASTAVMTKIEAMADLALEVSDPPGPVPVGGEATYEVRIHNRGTKPASGVEVVAYFSRGIEPVAVEGSPYSIGPGQVVFDAIGGVPAGKEVVLKIRARADVPGNHMFRTEVYCKPLGTKLVGEETTHFYSGGLVNSSPGAAAASGPQGPPQGPPPLETADQRNLPSATPVPAGPGQAIPGRPVPVDPVPGQAVPGRAIPGQAAPGQVVPGQVVPGQAAPTQAVPAQPAAPMPRS